MRMRKVFLLHVVDLKSENVPRLPELRSIYLDHIHMSGVTSQVLYATSSRAPIDSVFFVGITRHSVVSIPVNLSEGVRPESADLGGVLIPVWDKVKDIQVCRHWS